MLLNVLLAAAVTLTYQGRTRQYLLYVPANPNGALILAFHGGGQTGAQMEATSGFDALADREHFIVAYPDAVDRVWYDGRDFGRKDVDDVGFAKAVVDDIARTHTVDRTRVFAAGLSNGANLVTRIGCEAADAFAAIAVVSGTIATNILSSCRPARPVAAI